MVEDPLLSQAAAAKVRGDFKAVVALLEPALASSVPGARALGGLGYAYFQLGRFAESASCWERLLRFETSPRILAKLQANLGKASYFAAKSAAQAGDYATAARFQAVYCGFYRGDEVSQRLWARLSLESSKTLILEGRWSEAADALIAARSKAGETVR